MTPRPAVFTIANVVFEPSPHQKQGAFQGGRQRAQVVFVGHDLTTEPADNGTTVKAAKRFSNYG
jgi:hypothetical protein